MFSNVRKFIQPYLYLPKTLRTTLLIQNPKNRFICVKGAQNWTILDITPVHTTVGYKNIFP